MFGLGLILSDHDPDAPSDSVRSPHTGSVRIQPKRGDEWAYARTAHLHPIRPPLALRISVGNFQDRKGSLNPSTTVRRGHGSSTRELGEQQVEPHFSFPACTVRPIPILHTFL
jgi:hypothetical protein